jgi:hypothetical protein
MINRVTLLKTKVKKSLATILKGLWNRLQDDYVSNNELCYSQIRRSEER